MSDLNISAYKQDDEIEASFEGCPFMSKKGKENEANCEAKDFKGAALNRQLIHFPPAYRIPNKIALFGQA